MWLDGCVLGGCQAMKDLDERVSAMKVMLLGEVRCLAGLLEAAPLSASGDASNNSTPLCVCGACLAG
jgi:hypothetical protein